MRVGDKVIGYDIRYYPTPKVGVITQKLTESSYIVKLSIEGIELCYADHELKYFNVRSYYNLL